MKILRLQLPRKLVDIFNLSNMFSDVERIEIINAYQYDKKNFFAMQRIMFAEGFLSNIDDIKLGELMTEKFDATDFELMERHNNTILCTMKQKRESGFWKILEPGPWAFVFPIIVDQTSILATIFTSQEYVDSLKKILRQLGLKAESYDVLAQSTISALNQIGMANIPVPDFTERQIEISSFAAQNGYFQTPKNITAKDIASKYNISVSAVNEHLRKAEHKAMTYFFGKQR
ncbi:MAG: hypothetical protein GF364_04610 [Candidatus Lokiarchaeota archaeon]|nr:hypothetical protein [Candidatus Lokiarchaeota archaeon]